MARFRRGPYNSGQGPFAATGLGPTWKRVALSTLFSTGGTAATFEAAPTAIATAIAALRIQVRFAAAASATATATAALSTRAFFAATATAQASATATFIDLLPGAAAVATASARLLERAGSGGQSFLRQFVIDASAVSGTLSGFGYDNSAVIFIWAPHQLSVVGDGVVDLTGAWTKVASASAIEGSAKWICTAWLAPLPATAATRTYSFQFSSGRSFPEAVMGVQYIRSGTFVNASTVAYAPGGPTLLVPPAMPVTSTRGVLASAWFSSASLIPLTTVQGWPDPSQEFRDTEGRTAIGFSSSSGSLALVSTPLADDFTPAQRGAIVTASSTARGVVSLLFQGATSATAPLFAAKAESRAVASARLGAVGAPPAITYIGTTTDLWRPVLSPTPAPPEVPNQPNRATYRLILPPGESNDLLILTMTSDAQELELTDLGWTLAAPPRQLFGQSGDPRYRLYVYWRYDEQSRDGSPGIGYNMVMRGVGQFNTPYDCQVLIQCHRWRGAQVMRPGYLFGEAVEAANSGFVTVQQSQAVGDTLLGTTLARAPNTAVADANSVIMAVWARNMSVAWNGTTTAPAGMTVITGTRQTWRNSTEQLDYLLLSAYKAGSVGQTGDLDLTNSPEMLGRAGVSLVIRPQGVGALFHATAVTAPVIGAGTLTGSTSLAATAGGVATATAALTTAAGNTMAAAGAATATATATLRTGSLLAAAGTGVASASAALATGQGFAAQAAAQATAQTDLYTRTPIAATATATASVTASLLTLWPAYATLLAQASATAALRAAPRFYAAAQAVASASATPPAEKPPGASWALLEAPQTAIRTEEQESLFRSPL